MSAANQKITAQAWLILICGGVGLSLAFAVIIGVSSLVLSSSDSTVSATPTPIPSPPPVVVVRPPAKDSSASDNKQTSPVATPPPIILPPTPVPAPSPPPPPSPQSAPQPLPTTPTGIVEREHWATYKNERSSQPRFENVFIGFSFKYPADRFVFDPGHLCFCKLDKNLMNSAAKMTLETITVLPIPINEVKQCVKNPKVGYPKVLHRLGNAMAQALPGYQEIAMRTGTLGGMGTRELLFKAYVSNTAQGNVWYFGRLIAAVKGNQGIALILSASSTLSEIKSAEDVGVKADMGGILETFQFTGG